MLHIPHRTASGETRRIRAIVRDDTFMSDRALHATREPLAQDAIALFGCIRQGLTFVEITVIGQHGTLMR